MSEPQAVNGGDIPVQQHAPASTPKQGGEIRLSFRFFYVVLKWGNERRSATRINDDRRAFPVLTATHAPVLVGVWTAVFMLMYFMLKSGLEALVYVFSS